MTQCTVNIASPINTVEIITDLNSILNASTQQSLQDDTQAQIAHYQLLCSNLTAQTSQMADSFNQMICNQKSQIAKLALEIARKVISQKVSEKDYEIQSIIETALESSPSKTDITINLNPQDLENLPSENFKGINFVANPDIGPAELMIEGPKGIIKSQIDSHLENIEKALTGNN